MIDRTPIVAQQRYLDLLHASGVYREMDSFMDLYLLACDNFAEGRWLDLFVLRQARAEQVRA